MSATDSLFPLVPIDPRGSLCDTNEGSSREQDPGREEAVSPGLQAARSSQVGLVVRVCGATQTYYGDERGWWLYDWPSRRFTSGRASRV